MTFLKGNRNNKINWFTEGSVIKCVAILHSENLKQNGGRRSTFAGNIALLPCNVIDFKMLPAQRILAGNSFYCLMSGDLESANKSARCREKISRNNNNNNNSGNNNSLYTSSAQCTIINFKFVLGLLGYMEIRSSRELPQMMRLQQVRMNK